MRTKKQNVNAILIYKCVTEVFLDMTLCYVLINDEQIHVEYYNNNIVLFY